MTLPRRLAIAILLTAGCLGWGARPAPAADPPPSSDAVSYFRQVRPILQESCQGCHQPAKREGGLDVTTVPAVVKGGESEEPGIVPGKPDGSNLLGPDHGQARQAARDAQDRQALVGRPGGPDPPLDRAGGPRRLAPAAKATIDRTIRPCTPPRPSLRRSSFSPDGTLLAVSGYHEVLLHKSDGSGIAARLVGLSERIQSAVFSPDGTRLAVTGGSPCRMGEVQVWDVASRKMTLSRPVTFDTVYGASWSATASSWPSAARTTRFGRSTPRRASRSSTRAPTTTGSWTRSFRPRERN